MRTQLVQSDKQKFNGLFNFPEKDSHLAINKIWSLFDLITLNNSRQWLKT